MLGQICALHAQKVSFGPTLTITRFDFPVLLYYMQHSTRHCIGYWRRPMWKGEVWRGDLVGRSWREV